VNRGAYVLKNILGTPPPEPPPDVPALPRSRAKSSRCGSAWEKLRAAPACAGCHHLMDPIGLILESYDGTAAAHRRHGHEPVDQNGGMVHVLRDSGVLEHADGLAPSHTSASPSGFVRTATRSS
jgi:hypothetical protein